MIETTPLKGYKLRLEERITIHGPSHYVYVLKRELAGGRLSVRSAQQVVNKDSLSNCMVILELNKRSFARINKCDKTLEKIRK